MFTIEQIKTAHARVKSGADFPAYIKEIKALGVHSYETFVSDGHTEFSGAGHSVTSPAKYETLVIAGQSNKNDFLNDLKAHQQGKTDYPAFCGDAARSGIEKWQVRMDEMTCTYYDKNGNKILTEQIPEV